MPADRDRFGHEMLTKMLTTPPTVYSLENENPAERGFRGWS
jgi:hypothetical protein